MQYFIKITIKTGSSCCRIKNIPVTRSEVYPETSLAVKFWKFSMIVLNSPVKPGPVNSVIVSSANSFVFN